jgi:hypothetical protein
MVDNDTTGVHDEPILVPVGMPLGYFESADGETAEIRRGERRHQMSSDLYAFWQAVGHLRTRVEIRRWAGEEQVPNVDEALGDLTDAGLVIELDGVADRDAAILSRHRLLPMGYGLGNTAEKPELFHISDQHGAVLVSVNGFTFAMWAISDGYRSITGACRAAAEMVEVDLDAVLSYVPRSLSALVMSGAGVLDVLGKSDTQLRSL